jgi:predicted unusual protein kinase regulating ubiquinone biosynthesis (AarF/ABC1/UbiB family)
MLVNIRDIVANYELLFNIFFQTFISIASFHNLTGFVHKDAHYGNFLYQINNERGYYHYICNGKDYYLKSCKYNIIIYDYGFSKKINENMNNNLIVKRESRYVFEDYSRILHAFMNKKTGWGKYDNLPNDRINDIIMNINNILNNNIYLELTSNVTNNIPYSKRIINDIIKDVFLKYTPRDMFITIRPQNVLNEIPFSID